jgi:hypothetical protein
MVETSSTTHGTMPNRMRPHEMSLLELSERAEGYTALATGVTENETRETFERLATLYARLAVERKAQEKQPTRH